MTKTALYSAFLMFFLFNSVQAEKKFTISFDSKPEFHQIILFSGGYSIPAGNKDWWSSLKIRSNLEEADFIAPQFRFSYGLIPDSREYFFSLNLDYFTSKESGAYKQSFINSIDSLILNLPEDISVDLDLELTLMEVSLAAGFRPVHHSFFEIYTGLGGGLSWWKLGIAENWHDEDYQDYYNYNYEMDSSIAPFIYPFINIVLYKQIFLNTRYTFMRTEEKVWDTELSFDNLSLSLGLVIYEF